MIESLPNELLRPILMSSVDRRQHLRTARAVSKRFNCIVTPEFWHTIHLDMLDRPESLSLLIGTLQKTPDIGLLVNTLMINLCDYREHPPRPLPFGVSPSRTWIAKTYSPGFVSWFCDDEDTVSTGSLVALLLVHLPRVRQLLCRFGLSHYQDYWPLVRLFRYCKSVRLCQRDSALAVSSSTRIPMARLSTISIRHSYDGLDAPLESSLAGLPLERLEIYRPIPELSGLPRSSFHLLKELVLLRIPFRQSTIRNILVAAPGLECLVYHVDASHNLSTPVVDLSLIGDVIRDLGRGLPKLRLEFSSAEDEEIERVGKLGSLRTLTLLRHLYLTTDLLIDDDATCTMENVIPESLLFLGLTSFRLPKRVFSRRLRPERIVEKRLDHLLRTPQDYKALVRVSISWKPEEIEAQSGWIRRKGQADVSFEREYLGWEVAKEAQDFIQRFRYSIVCG